MNVTGPIEVWLSQSNLTVTCTIVAEDETTDELEVNSLSMNGAQREITGWLIKQGFAPVGRWVDEAESEVSRKFRPQPGRI